MFLLSHGKMKFPNLINTDKQSLFTAMMHDINPVSTNKNRYAHKFDIFLKCFDVTNVSCAPRYNEQV